MTSPAVTIAPTRLGTVDRFLPVWILLAMAAGLVLAVFVPAVGDALHSSQVGSVSVPIAVGLLVMMYPVLAKVRYSNTRGLAGDRKLLISSLVLNWVLGPALMFALAWMLLPDLPEYRTGLIIVGLARCIAMVLIWNDLACGDREAAAFLGIPLIAGYLSRTIGEATRGRDWYETTFLPKVSPCALYGLLFTIVMLFALQGQQVVDRPLDVLRIAVPLLVYFVVMFGVGVGLGTFIGLTYERTTTLAFTAAGNNFELAIAVAIGTFGATSGQALAGIVGPLIEVPALVALVYVSLWLRPRLFATVPDEPSDAPLPVSVSTRG